MGDTTTRPGQSLTYDAEERLSTLTASGSTQSNVYDADGNLLISTDGSGTTAYLGDTEIHVTTGGVVTSTRTYSAQGLGALAERDATSSASQLYFLDADNVGTVNAIINTANNPTYRFSDPYGAPRGTATTTWPDQHGYLNKPTNTTTGLTQLGARDYDPVLGAFLSVDPVLDPTSPQSLNGYSYASADPVTLSDPSGLHTDDRSLYGGNDSSSNYNPSVPDAGGYVPPPGNNSSGNGGKSSNSSANRTAGLFHGAGGMLDGLIQGANFNRNTTKTSSCWSNPGACGSHLVDGWLHADTDSPDYLTGEIEFNLILAVPTDGIGEIGFAADATDTTGPFADLLRIFESAETPVGEAQVAFGPAPENAWSTFDRVTWTPWSLSVQVAKVCSSGSCRQVAATSVGVQ